MIRFLKTFAVLMWGGLAAMPLLAEEPGDSRALSSPRPFTRSSLVVDSTVVYTNGVRKSPSPAKAALFSFVVPGTGEWATGSKSEARIFASAEILLWAGFGILRLYGAWKEDDYMHFASAHAGIDPGGKDHDYFVAMEGYATLREYNEAQLRNRNPDAMYPETAEYDWEWDSEGSQRSYEKLRVSSDNAFSRSLLVVGAVVVNHLVSAIDAYRLARRARNSAGVAARFGVTGFDDGSLGFAVRVEF